MSILLPSRRFMLSAPWVRNDLWRRARAVPAVDFPFAATRSLTDIAGSQLATFSRSGGQTFANASGILEIAASGVPAFEHDPLTGECLGVLPEENRVNLLLRSEEFDNAYWTKSGLLAFGSGSTANATTAPNGTLTADLLTESTTSSEKTCYRTGITTTTATLSFYIKPNGRNFAGIRFYAAGNNWVRVTFGLTGAGSASAIAAGSLSSYTGTSAVITAAANGWYRASLSGTRVGGLGFVTCDLATSVSPSLSSTAGNEIYTGDGTSGSYLWGAQLEAGALTSYIPSGAASGSRSATVMDLVDTALVNGLRTFFVEFRSPAVGTRGVFSVNDNTANERAELLTSGVDPRFIVVDNSSEQANINGGTVSAFTRTRVAMRLQANGFACSINGGPVSTDNTGTLPTVDRLMFGRTQAGEYLNAPLARFTGWREELPDPALQDLAR